jgi:ureidoglycolate lyase
VIAETLTAEAFAPFGDVLARPAAAADASGPGWSWWTEIARLPAADRPYAVGFLALEPADRAFDWAEHHQRSAELIAPLGGECLVYVAPPAAAPDGFRAFRVGAGEGVVLEPGVWHGAPLALDRPLTAAVLLLEGTGAEDTVVTQVPRTTITVEEA